MAVLILDREALSALARPNEDRARHQRVRAALRTAQRRGQPVRVPSAVLVEIYRGGGTDEPVDQVLGRGFVRVVTTGVRIARVAGTFSPGRGAGAIWLWMRSWWLPLSGSAAA